MFAPQQASPVTIEDQIVDHVIKHGRYHNELKKPFYAVQYGARMFHADDTRTLVRDICKSLGIKTRP
jgi:hypothetical protein